MNELTPLTTAKDRGGCLDREPPRQRAKTTKHALFVRAEQLITPGDRRIDRPLAFGEIASWADGREQDILRESAKQFLDRQHLDPWGRKLEGEREGIEPATNRGHCRAVRGRETKVRLHVPHAFDEESHGRSAREIGR